MVSRFGWLVSEVVLELKSKLFSRTLKQNTNQNGMEMRTETGECAVFVVVCGVVVVFFRRGSSSFISSFFF